jgi:FixJ family two-component response regulator
VTKYFMSGHPDIRAAVRAIKTGAIEVLAKPLDLAVVVETVREALAEPKAAVEKGRSGEAPISPLASIAKGAGRRPANRRRPAE